MSLEAKLNLFVLITAAVSLAIARGVAAIHPTL